MNENHIFIDTNVLVGAAAGFQEDKKCLHYLYSMNGKQLFVSSLSIAQYVSIFNSRKKENDLIKNEVKLLLHRYNVLSCTEDDIQNALKRTEKDLEDSIQYTISQKKDCKYIITNNVKDFRSFEAMVLTPKEVRFIKE